MKTQLILAALLLGLPFAAANETPAQLALRERFLEWRFGMFIHFNMATFNNRQWATGTEDPATFAPTNLDCGQWLDAAKAAGMNYAVLTVKHTGGWCLWDSKHTGSHDIANFRNFRDGKGDLVRDFVDACRQRGIKVGLYYCMPGDFAKRHLPKGVEDKLHGLPPEAQGRRTEFIKLQLTELLTRYGEIDLLWFDQYSNPYTVKDWREIKAHVKSHQPGCVVIANNSVNFNDTDIHSYEYPYLKAMKRPVVLPPEGNKHPAEVCDVLGRGWFWTPAENEASMKSVEHVTDMLELCRNRRANYLLNVGPDNTGRLTDYTVKRLREIGQRINAPRAKDNQAQVLDPQNVWTDPDAALRDDADFALQGEYAGQNKGAQVVALGAGVFECYLLDGGLPGAGWEPGKPRQVLKGKREGDGVSFKDENGANIAMLQDGKLTVIGTGNELKRTERNSPTLGAKPPAGAVVLFDGTSTDAWQNGKMENGHLLSTGATSKQNFGDYTMHLEFRTPYMPAARGQKRGNSGVYHSGRWETQVLDSFGLEGRDNECGGIYSISKPRLNMCLPPLAWQTYDVEFTAAKFDANGKRTVWPRITVRLNGVLVHENLELSKDFTTSAPLNSPLSSPEGPVFIQNHNDPVVFRNIWIVPAS